MSTMLKRTVYVTSVNHEVNWFCFILSTSLKFVSDLNRTVNLMPLIRFAITAHKLLLVITYTVKNIMNGIRFVWS